jgi:anaerobic magnesium-protoporphyrin IX monomethyl ester cyclase
MTSVLLVYPFFRGSRDRSRFRFPPLGPAYVAAALREAGHDVELLDCTFLRRDEALATALAAKAEVVGVYGMATLTHDCLWFATHLRGRCDLLVAGGPLPTCDPAAFLDHFDVVVRGEGEQTMCEIVAAYEAGSDLGSVAGAVRRGGAGAPTSGEGAPADGEGVPADGAGVPADGGTAAAAPAQRPLSTDLDGIAFPARELLPNDRYIEYGKKTYGYAMTTVMSTRGCPFDCEFCSNVVFGRSYRERSPANVVDEIEEALALGYDRISFADDVFTLNRGRVSAICEEIARRGLRFSWECLGRVDALDFDTARQMKDAGCFRVFFGIESGSDEILRLMNKQITTRQARDAVWAAHRAGLEVGAFFIVYYPGETDDTVLATLRFAGSLPLDYLGLTMPYPLPATALAERVGVVRTREWRQDGGLLLNQTLTFDAGVSATKMRFAIVKGHAQFEMKRRLGRVAPPALRLFEKSTDGVLRLLR